MFPEFCVHVLTCQIYPVAMDGAASSGALEVVKWLHRNRTEGSTTAAMNEAARNGHIRVV
ncbi:hypothetical protein PHMEG_000307 [Phytophthora megakarya]|uniref:Uncharacterized protein n=1 Tax=Phytophthora megakarya TaxID=4795 RepID=A0A225X3X0_9STRA|nr:hypothetical protein PHMEG_000307 [Phytophthora megakarya]